jgi:hypothetical protein
MSRKNKMRSLKYLSVLAAAALLVGCQTGDPSSQLPALFDKEWDFRVSEDPLLATSVGNHTANDRLPSMSEADQAGGWPS